MLSFRFLFLQAVFVFASSELVLIQKTVNVIARDAHNGETNLGEANFDEKKALADMKELKPAQWTEFKYKYSAGYAAGLKKRFTSLDEAQAKCVELGADYCQAVTCNTQGTCTVRGSSVLRNSAFAESTYLVEGAGMATSCKAQAGCSVYEDQHVVVFDGPKISLLEQPELELPDMSENLINKLITKESSGDVWLVKSSSVKIQARFLPEEAHHNKVKVRAVAVGGAFMNGSKLVIEGLDGKVTWDGEEILTEADSEFLSDGKISALRHNFSCLVEDMNKRVPGIDVKLPKGVMLTINRQPNHVNVHITMPQLGGGQDGLCGNNNGDSSDDQVDLIIERRKPIIAAQESLLPPVPESLMKSLYKILTGSQESLQSRALQPDSRLETSKKEAECTAEGGCSVYDDQNIVVFDGSKISLLGETGKPSDTSDQLAKMMDKMSGDMWLVKSRPVSIQARYVADEGHPNKPKVRAIAVGGAFLNGSKLVIEPMDGKVTWNGAEILAEPHSEFQHGQVSAQRHDYSCKVQDMSKRIPGIDVKLPRGVQLTVNRQEKHVNVHITMPHMAGQDGLCGNNNGDASDDEVELIIEKRHPTIAAAESLLPPVSQNVFKSLFR